jgi:hypothetical protein
MKNYQMFQLNLPDLMNKLQLHPDDLSYADKVQLVEQWLGFMQKSV